MNTSKDSRGHRKVLRIQLGEFDWLAIAAQAIAIVALFYAILRTGAVEIGTQMHICILIIIPLVIVALRSGSEAFARPKIVALLAACWVAWLALALLQVAPLPESLTSALSPQGSKLRNDFGASPGKTLSLIPMMTQLAWPQYVIGFAFFLIGASAFRSRRSRTAFLISVCVAGGAFACWGLLQRARGSFEVLPGVAAPDRAVPFSTINYKNAAAALLLATLAAGLGLVMTLFRQYLRDKTRSLRNGDKKIHSSRRGYGLSSQALEIHAIILYIALAVISTAIVVSLSRGAWISLVLATLATSLLIRKFFFTKKTLIGLAAMLIVGVIAIQVMGVGRRVMARASQTNVATLSSNDRISHWKDSAETVLQYPLLGSGLGTYGYATLPNQDADTPRWFEHAHNQPLEWAVEFGLLGMAILLVGCIAVCVLLKDLYRDRFESSTPLIWFVVCAFAMVSICTQSLADFVLCTPAVMWTYAMILGVTCSAVADGSKARGKRQRTQTIKTIPEQPEASFLVRLLCRPVGWSLVCLAALLLSQYWLQQEIVDNKLLMTTKVPSAALTPNEKQIDRVRNRLLARVESRPQNAKLWQRLALWDLASFRLDLIKESEQDDQRVSWQQTDLSRIFGIYYDVPSEDREQLLAEWINSPQRRDALEAAKTHFKTSIDKNPLVSKVHLQTAWMAPLIEEEWQKPARRCRLLSACNGDIQFANGLLAYHVRDNRTMVNQWARGLRFKPQNLSYVVTLASRRVSPQVLANDVLGDLRGNLWISLINDLSGRSGNEQFLEAFIPAAKEAVRKDPSMLPGKRHYHMAVMSRIVADNKKALKHLRAAVDTEPSNADYRYQLALTLMRAGDLMEAREEASLGRALKPRQPRWNNLIDKIDRKLAANQHNEAPKSKEIGNTAEFIDQPQRQQPFIR